jgi:hypothetical protein
MRPVRLGISLQRGRIRLGAGGGLAASVLCAPLMTPTLSNNATQAGLCALGLRTLYAPHDLGKLGGPGNPGLQPRPSTARASELRRARGGSRGCGGGDRVETAPRDREQPALCAQCLSPDSPRQATEPRLQDPG